MLFVYHGLYVNGWVTPHALQLERSHLIYSITFSSCYAVYYTWQTCAEVDSSSAHAAKSTKLGSAPLSFHTAPSSLVREPRQYPHPGGCQENPTGDGKSTEFFSTDGTWQWKRSFPQSSAHPAPSWASPANKNPIAQTSAAAFARRPGRTRLWIAKAASQQSAAASQEGRGRAEMRDGSVRDRG